MAELGEMTVKVEVDATEIARLVEEAMKKYAGTGPIFGSSGSRRSMAHPAAPWPYGTVLRPKGPIGGRDVHIMWIGRSQAMPLNGFDNVGEVLEFPAADHTGWEIAPEPDL